LMDGVDEGGRGKKGWRLRLEKYLHVTLIKLRFKLFVLCFHLPFERGNLICERRYFKYERFRVPSCI
jgi:hypothetical protein